MIIKMAGNVPELFLPPVAVWFKKTFRNPSPVQEMAWPVIQQGKNCLLLAPTGSGKTLAAFLMAIDSLLRKSRDGTLEDKTYVLYITPLKALGNDIHRNLIVPLEGIGRETGRGDTGIRTAVRSGDTRQAERVKMSARPPHILITTPESLYLLLLSKHMETALAGVGTVIVDEVHSLCTNKRGVHLAVSLERLQYRAPHNIQRIGCSATIRPLDRIAEYLAGYDAEGKKRDCCIIDAGIRKGLDIRVDVPVVDFFSASRSTVWNNAYELLLEAVDRAGHLLAVPVCK